MALHIQTSPKINFSIEDKPVTVHVVEGDGDGDGDGWSMSTLRLALTSICQSQPNSALVLIHRDLCVVGCGDGDGDGDGDGMCLDANKVLSHVVHCLGGRGGGSRKMAQGKLTQNFQTIDEVQNLLA